VPPAVPRTPNHYHLGKTEVFQVQEGQEGYHDAQPIQQAMVRVAGPSLSFSCSQLCFHVEKFCLVFHLSALSCAELPRTCQLISAVFVSPPCRVDQATSDRKGILGAGAFGQVHWFVDEDSDQKFCLKFQVRFLCIK
jgi:hypothetical protein